MKKTSRLGALAAFGMLSFSVLALADDPVISLRHRQSESSAGQASHGGESAVLAPPYLGGTGGTAGGNYGMPPAGNFGGPSGMQPGMGYPSPSYGNLPNSMGGYPAMSGYGMGPGSNTAIPSYGMGTGAGPALGGYAGYGLAGIPGGTGFGGYGGALGGLDGILDYLSFLGMGNYDGFGAYGGWY